MEFKEYLKQLREANKLSLRKLDAMSGVSHVYLSQSRTAIEASRHRMCSRSWPPRWASPTEN